MPHARTWRAPHAPAAVRDPWADNRSDMSTLIRIDSLVRHPHFSQFEQPYCFPARAWAACRRSRCLRGRTHPGRGGRGV